MSPLCEKAIGVVSLFAAVGFSTLLMLSTSFISSINLVTRNVTVDGVNATLGLGTCGYCLTLSNVTNSTCPGNVSFSYEIDNTEVRAQMNGHSIATRFLFANLGVLIGAVLSVSFFCDCRSWTRFFGLLGLACVGVAFGTEIALHTMLNFDVQLLTIFSNAYLILFFFFVIFGFCQQKPPAEKAPGVEEGQARRQAQRQPQRPEMQQGPGQRVYTQEERRQLALQEQERRAAYYQMPQPGEPEKPKSGCCCQ